MQLEVVDESGQQVPPGFHVITLPYADDLREVPFETEIRGKSLTMS